MERRTCQGWLARSVMTVFLLGAMECVAWATTYDVHSGDDLFSIWASLSAGDEVVVHDGTYTVGGYHTQEWHGTETSPIVVRAADGEHAVVQGDASQNAMNLTGEYFTFRGIEIKGGSHGLRLDNVHDALIEDLEIHNTDDVALSANRDGSENHHITFRRLHLHDTGGSGEGMYLGCNNAGCIFHDNVIEDSWIHDTNHGVAQGDGIEIKVGSYGNVVRNNVIYNTHYPCIIVYGTQGHAQNVLENNVMWDCGDSGIQAAADTVIQNNLIFRAGEGINSHTHQGAVPSNLVIVNNTVVDCSDQCLRSSDWAGSTGIVVANNAFYCDNSGAVRIASGGSEIVFTNNVVTGTVQGVSSGYIQGNGMDQDLTDPANLDAWPKDGCLLIDAGDATYAPTVDYNWATRDDHPDIGAYEWQSSGNPGWKPGPGYRPLSDGGVLPDGSVDDGGTTPDGAALDGQSDHGDSGTQGDGAATGDGSSSSSSSDSGCSCRSTSDQGAVPLSVLLGIVGLFLWVRRKQV
ncbi:MAG: right-handed parallel beta-helix repeat-containing protein [Deltaproteobacteria bacterium]|nr:right-handed parallel beta-helix repeat-containing protein [Deltaproteobacteria bacterium]